MKLHGNYCGPNWSDGKAQESVDGKTPPVDSLDALCQAHDAAYFHSKGMEPELRKKVRQQADWVLAKRVWTATNPAEAALYTAGMLAQMTKRSIENYNSGDSKSKQKMPNLRSKNISRNNSVAADILLNMPKPTPTPSQAAKAAIPAANISVRTTKRAQLRTVNGNVVLSHRGLVANVMNSTTFSATTNPVNPGLASTFPWASRIGRSFDKYRFRKLTFEYHAVCPTSVAGVVMLTFDYDANDNIPQSKFEHSQSSPGVETSVYTSCRLNVPVDNQWRFVRQGAVTGDIKTYDIGGLVFSTSYGSNTGIVGEIYVSYEVEFSKPSVGYPLTVVSQTSGALNAPFGTITSQAGTAQPVTVYSASSLLFQSTGEFIMVFKCDSAATLSRSILPTLQSGSSGSTKWGQFYTTGSTSMVITLAVRAMAGDTLSCANMVSGGPLTNLQFYVAESEYTFS